MKTLSRRGRVVSIHYLMMELSERKKALAQLEAADKKAPEALKKWRGERIERAKSDMIALKNAIEYLQSHEPFISGDPIRLPFKESKK